MYAFTYERPVSQADALALIQAGGKALAGGQTLLASMKLRLAAPEQIVDLGLSLIHISEPTRPY